MLGFNSDQIEGIIRAILQWGGAYFVQHGYATTDQTTQVIGGLMAAFGVLWSIHSNKTGVVNGATVIAAQNQTGN